MRTRSPLLIPSLLLALALSACQGVGTGRTPIHYDIGLVHRAVSTDSPEAQLWFDRGLGLAYGFNHEQAVACFQRAAEADPDLAMAWWGQAWALGTNYNMPVMDEAASEAAWNALQEARARASGASPAERALIEALSARYAWPAPEDRSELEQAYADAMTDVHRRFPDDADVAALTAEALMQLRPWGLWSPPREGGVAAPETPAIRAVLEPALERWPEHPALCHLYIHTMEAGPEVAKALPAARRLEDLTPGLGHLVHMPSHIYVWTGHYDDVVRVNVDAVEIDDRFVEHAGRDNIYTAYRIHNYHFVTYGAMWEGRRALALEYSRRLCDEIPEGLLTSMPDLFEVFTATPYHAMVRFGMWNELLEEPEPLGERQSARAVWRYARGVALASLGRVDEARAEQRAFRQARDEVPETRILFQNPVSNVLAVADEVLEGEIAYREGQHERAFQHLRKAVELDDAMNYDEPWGWMEPARHALGALLTEQGRFEEALSVYEADLERYPENGWALFGMAECLRGLGRAEEAARAQKRFDKAFARADVEIPGSCYCKGAGARPVASR